jgi:hypothetical protein
LSTVLTLFSIGKDTHYVGKYQLIINIPKSLPDGKHLQACPRFERWN